MIETITWAVQKCDTTKLDLREVTKPEREPLVRERESGYEARESRTRQNWR
jgi:hypothetical protein